jgi:hypothetical protein
MSSAWFHPYEWTDQDMALLGLLLVVLLPAWIFCFRRRRVIGGALLKPVAWLAAERRFRRDTRERRTRRSLGIDTLPPGPTLYPDQRSYQEAMRTGASDWRTSGIGRDRRKLPPLPGRWDCFVARRKLGFTRLREERDRWRTMTGRR